MKAFRAWKRVSKLKRKAGRTTGLRVLFRRECGTCLTGKHFNKLLKRILGRDEDSLCGVMTTHSFR